MGRGGGAAGFFFFFFFFWEKGGGGKLTSCPRFHLHYKSFTNKLDGSILNRIPPLPSFSSFHSYHHLFFLSSSWASRRLPLQISLLAFPSFPSYLVSSPFRSLH